MAFAEALRIYPLYFRAAEHAVTVPQPSIEKTMHEYARNQTERNLDPTVRVLQIQSAESGVKEFLYRERVYTDREFGPHGMEVLVRSQGENGHKLNSCMVKYRAGGEFVDVTRLPEYQEKFQGRDISFKEQFRYAAEVTRFDTLSHVKVKIF